MSTRGIWSAGVALGALFLSGSVSAQELTLVAQKFLQRRGVPCVFVFEVGSPADLGEIVTCQDGRKWALFWIEDEIAFVDPRTHALYRWDWENYLSHPELYGGPKRPVYNVIPVGDGR